MNVRVKPLLTFVALSVVLAIFWDHPLVWPLKILVVLFHELGHAAMAWLTGGEVVSIGLSPDQGGVTYTRGGWRIAILNAGYLGSLGFGVGLLAAARTETGARTGAYGLAVLLAGVSLWFVRPLLSFGFAFSALSAALLWGFARRASSDVNQLAVRGLGVFSVMYAVWDIRSDILWSSNTTSDAAKLAELTWIPATVWGFAWLGLGLATLVATRHWWFRA